MMPIFRLRAVKVLESKEALDISELGDRVIVLNFKSLESPSVPKTNFGKELIAESDKALS
jgi:hypothetical protein